MEAEGHRGWAERRKDGGGGLPSCQSADYSSSCNRSMAYRYHVLEFGFEDAVEIF